MATAQNGTGQISTDVLNATTGLNGGVPDVTNEQVQRAKVGFGSDSFFRDVDASNGLPVVSNDTTATGTLTAAAQTVALALNGKSGVALQITGTWVGTISFEGTLDGVVWTTIFGLGTTLNIPATSTTVNAITRFNGSGLAQFRVNATAWTSGTATITLRACDGATGTFLLQQLPQGGNLIGSATAVGSTAQAVAASGNPVSVAAIMRTALSGNVTTGTTERIIATTGGQVLVKPYGLPELDWTFAGAAGGIINTTDVVLKAAGAAGIRNYITNIDLTNGSATATEVVIKDGATVIWRTRLAANAPTIDIQFLTPLRGTAATALNVACITTASAIYVNAQGYQAP